MNILSFAFFIFVAFLLFSYLSVSERQHTKRIELIVELAKEVNKMEGTKEEKEKALKKIIKDIK